MFFIELCKLINTILYGFNIKLGARQFKFRQIKFRQIEFLKTFLKSHNSKSSILLKKNVGLVQRFLIFFKCFTPFWKVITKLTSFLDDNYKIYPKIQNSVYF